MFSPENAFCVLLSIDSNQVLNDLYLHVLFCGTGGRQVKVKLMQKTENR